MNRRKLSEQEIQFIIDFYLDGYSVSKVATEAHVCRDYVKDILLEHNIKLRTAEEQANLRADSVRKTCLKKYGVENAFQADWAKEKMKATNLERYGVEYYNCAEQAKQKLKQTWQNKSQDEIDARTAKFKQTNLKRYGVEVPSQSTIVRKKIKTTNLERYGLTSVLADKEKIKAAVIEKYGVENVFQSEEIKEKIKQSMVANYGVEHFFQSELNMCKSVFRKYVFNDEYFDSLPELAVWLYMVDHNIDIQRNTSSFSYSFDGCDHVCFPDFVINGQLVEIKGDHLFKKMLIENTIENAKYHCLLENKVEVWTSAMYNKYLNWFNKKGYNKNDFKRK